MNGWLIDTNVVSEFRKPKPNPSVVSFFQDHPADTLAITEVTFAELSFGIARKTDRPEWQAETQAWLDGTLRPLFSERVFGITEGIILDWRTQVEEGRKRGHTFESLDLFIAVIALRNELIVLSRDVTHFQQAGAAILNPWDQLYISPSGRKHPLPKVKPDKLLSALGQLA